MIEKDNVMKGSPTANEENFFSENSSNTDTFPNASCTDEIIHITGEMVEHKALFSGNNIKEDLAKWAIITRTPHSKIGLLLSVLRKYNLEVPTDPRTLLSTPRSTEIKKMSIWGIQTLWYDGIDSKHCE